MMDVNQLATSSSTLSKSKGAQRRGGDQLCRSLGGADKVLLMLNNFDHMSKLFKTINIALEAKGGEA